MVAEVNGSLPPLFPLAGSKFRQRKNILPILARYNRTLYVEPFCGAGGLFFGKPPERAEVYNDANRAFVNLMRVVRNPQKLEQLEQILNSTPMSRDLWYEARDIARAYMRGESIETRKIAAGLESYEDDVIYEVEIWQPFILRATRRAATGRWQASIRSLPPGM